MHKTIASRLSARFQVDGSHLQRFLERSSLIKRAIIEDLVLHDRILIPTPDFLTADGLILILGERGMIDLLESERLQFVRTRSVLGFVRGKGKDGGLVVFSDPDRKRPQDANLDESIEAGLRVIEGKIKEKKILTDLLLQNSINIETSEILEAVRRESILDFKESAIWNPRFSFPNPDLVALPGIQKMQAKVIGMNPDPLGAPIDTLLELASYNSDLYLAEKFECINASPFFPIGDYLRIKARRTDSQSDALWSLFEINDIPDFSDIDLTEEGKFSELHKVTLSLKAKSFRNWFHSRESLTEKDILKEYLAVIQEIPWTQKLPTRILRFITTTGLGFIPGVGQVASIVDSFIFDRAFRKKSPKFFIDDLRQLAKTKSLQQGVSQDGKKRRP
ncbi:MAG: hypothetical protein ACXWT1_01450 [Methylobacter sp.]